MRISLPHETEEVSKQRSRTCTIPHPHKEKAGQGERFASPAGQGKKDPHFARSQPELRDAAQGVPITRHTVNKIKIARRSCYLHSALYNGLPTCFLCYYYSPAIPPLQEQANRSQSRHFYYYYRYHCYGRGRRLAARCNSHFNLPRKHPHSTDGKGGGKGVIYSSSPGESPPF